MKKSEVSEDESDDEIFNLEEMENKKFKKFNIDRNNYQLKFKNLPNNFVDSVEYLSKVMHKVLEKFKARSHEDDRLSIYIDHPELSDPIHMPFMVMNEVSSDSIINNISKVMQSNKRLTLDDKLTFQTTIYRKKSGSGRKQNVDDYLLKKDCIVHVKDEPDSFCLLRAFVLGQAYADDKNLFQTYRRTGNNLQTRKAYEIVSKFGWYDKKTFGIIDIMTIEKYLQHYMVILIDGDCLNKIVYKSDIDKDKKIILYCKNQHYYMIKSLPAFYEKQNYCLKCHKGYNSYRTDHPCENICKKCQNMYCTQQESVKCGFCGVLCSDDLCMWLHMLKVCGKCEKCKNCWRFNTYNHKCDGMWCQFCKMNVEKNHKCYIEVHEDIDEKKVLKKGYIFFDFESMHVKNVHIPNLIIAKKICFQCIKKQKCIDNCAQFCFYDNNAFCTWLFKQVNFIALAHNMKAYDGYFLMQYIVENMAPNDKLPEIVLQGSKLLVIQFRQVKIIDSYNFMPMALAKLPKAFGLMEKKKGFFPHYFNIPENQQYIGAYPEAKYYGVDYMNCDDNKEFYKWYETKTNETFNLQKELLEYCESDVDILSLSCLTFRGLFIECTKRGHDDVGVDPFLSCLTIASACHLVYRRNFMPKNSIALIPEFGYTKFETSSHKAITWIRYISKLNNIQIQHGRNGKEKQIGKYKLDGWCNLTKTGYEFHGCLYHGCPKCFKSQTFNPVLNEPMQVIYERHLERIRYIKQSITLHEIWECEYDEKIKNDPFLYEFAKTQRDLRPPLNPRKALSGGRTNSIQLYYEGKIGYVDFTSLYPYVQKYGKFPIGHPQIITENFDDIDNYFGLIYCKILPPYDLYLPVLPYHVNGKLVFPLCSTCAQYKNSSCNHLPHERELEGTWVILEVQEAIKRGYVITQIYEIWHFEDRAEYNIDTKSGGLFTKYVDTFLKIKQEACGYPEWVQTEHDKDKYITDYNQREGISLEKAKIKVNSGLKAISKLLLNSHWGRYAMQTNKTQAKFLTSAWEISNMFEKSEFIVKDIHLPNENVAITYYENKKDLHWGSKQTNVVLASFVTCQARIKLFLELEKLGENVLYFDTDSIIYKKNSIYEPKIGDYLGEFTNEIENNEEIVVFASAGPKNYTYKLGNGKEFTKVKGITLNFKNAKIIDFEKIRSIVFQQTNEEKVQTNTIVRNKKDWSLSTKNQIKTYKMIYDKRILFNNLTTLPFGYKK